MKFKKMVVASMLLALGMLLPLVTSQIKEIGDTLLPMHLPVLLCGFLCGPGYGLAVGLFLPFIKSAVFSMPPMYPNAVWMAFELASYGFVCGILYKRKKKPSTGYLYFCLITAMLSGRIVWGIVKAVLLGLGGKYFSLQAFIAGGFLDSLLGIVLQLILVPYIVKIENKQRRDGTQ